MSDKQTGYRVEYASSSRAKCKGPKPCSGTTIQKQELRFGSLVDFRGTTSFAWRHWGCVTPKVLQKMNEMFSEPSELDGYDDLKPEDQARVQKALEGGHVADEDIPQSARKEEGEEEDKPKKRTTKKKAAADAPAAAEGGHVADEDIPQSARKEEGEKEDKPKKRATKKKAAADAPATAEGGDESDSYATQAEPPHNPHVVVTLGYRRPLDKFLSIETLQSQLYFSPFHAFESDVSHVINIQFPKEDSNAHAALYFAVHDRHVQRVIVVGHTFCSGANASLQAAKRESGPTDPSLPNTHPFNRWLDPLTTFVRGLRKLPGFPRNDAVALTLVVVRNVWKQVDELCDSKVIQDAWKGNGPNRNLMVEGQVYDIINNTVLTIYTRPARSTPGTPPPFPSP